MGKGQKVAEERRIRFSQGIHAGLTQREALRQAGYKASEKSLDEMGPRLMKHPDVVAHLAKLRAAGDEKAVATRDELLRGLTADWRRDLGPYMVFEADGRFSHFDLAKLKADGKTAWLEELIYDEAPASSKAGTREPDTGDRSPAPARRVRMKFASRHGAADRLAKLLGLNAPKEMKHTIQDDPRTLTEDELKARILKKLKDMQVANPEKYLDGAPGGKGAGGPGRAGG